MDPHKDPPSTCRSPRLLEQVRDKLRTLHYSYRTEQQYLQWIRRFILFHDKRHPRTMGAPELEAFLTHLPVTRRVSASTQNQALAALLFLYQKVLNLELPWLKDVVRAKPSRYLPVVLTRKEVRAVLTKLEDEYWLIGSILYGGGLRLQEALRLRVKDVDFDLRQLVIRSGKGGKDRVTILPEVVVDPLQRHLEVVRAQHTQAMKRGHGGVRFAGSAQRGCAQASRVSGHRATPRQACRPGGRHRQAGHLPHVPPQLCHALARAWIRHSR